LEYCIRFLSGSRPTLTFRVHDTQYLFTFLVLAMVGILLSYTTARIRSQTEAYRKREREVTTLYHLARKLTTPAGKRTSSKRF